MRFIFILLSVIASQPLFSQVKDLYPTKVEKLSFTEEIKKLYAEVNYINENEKSRDLTEAERKRLDEILETEKIDETKVDWWDISGQGCSWYCCGSIDTVIATSHLEKNGAITYIGNNAGDDNYETAWVEGVEGYGIGESVTFYFTQGLGAIDEIIVSNGYVKTPKAYRENSRVKTLKLYHNDKLIANLHLKDELADQHFELGEVFGDNNYGSLGDPQGKENGKWIDKNGKTIPQWTFKFEIGDVYKGTKYEDTVISEIYFNGPCH